MNTRRLAAFLAAALLAGAAGAQTCYWLKRTGCGTGSGFCVANLRVCDEGYEAAPSGHAGKLGPVNSGPVARKCYVIKSTSTVPCNEKPIPSGYETVGCRDGNICCIAKTITQDGAGPAGDMHTPAGGSCVAP